MEKDKPLIMILEDELSQREYYGYLFAEIGFSVKTYSFYEDAVDALEKYEFDAFVVDLKIDVREKQNADAGGDTFMKVALQKYPGSPVAVISAHFGDDWGTRLTKLFMEISSCLYAHIEKPGEKKLKEWALEVLEYCNLKSSAKARSSNYHSEDGRVQNIITKLLPVVASSSLPVFIIGETGTGKEDIAKFIHNHPTNPFRKGPFVAVNCAAVNNELLLSELFGHVCGAYTGAYAHRLGLFLEASGWNYNACNKAKSASNTSYLQWLESCNKEIKYLAKGWGGKHTEDVVVMNSTYDRTDATHAEYIFADTNPGTLFLDEIGDLTPAAEAALLRALDGYGVRPLGYTGPALLPNCCIIAATNRIKNTSDLRDDDSMPNQNKKGIRLELYHRLAGWVLELPPLRLRRTSSGEMEYIVSLKKWAARDELYLDEQDLQQFAQAMEDNLSKVMWQGNWRELKYFYASAKAIASLRENNHKITLDDLNQASKWVLVSKDHISENGDNGGDIYSELTVNKEVEIRLDCILALNNVLCRCNQKDKSEVDKIIDEINFTDLHLCDNALAMLANKVSLTASLIDIIESGRITSPAVDKLMDNKVGAIKVWWKNNKTQIASLARQSHGKYQPIFGIIEQLSPKNFYMSNGLLQAR